MKVDEETLLPNFLIAGASKCGTTALYYYLKQHPAIGFPDLKEPKYFSSIHLDFPHKGPGDETVDKYAVKDLNEYKALFNGLDSYSRIGEASPDYIFYHQFTVQEIKRTLGDVPIILILRNPVDRAYSAYSYLVRDNRENLSFREALDAEEERLRENWDFIWAYKKGGEYYEQIKTFKENFSNVEIIVQERFRNNTDEIVAKIFNFLNVDDSVSIDTDIQHNKSGKPTNLIAKFLLSRNNKLSAGIREIMKKTIPRTILEKVASKNISKMRMNESDREYLKKYFADKNQKLFDYLGYRIEEWN